MKNLIEEIKNLFESEQEYDITVDEVSIEFEKPIIRDSEEFEGKIINVIERKVYIYRLSQDKNNGYDTYDSAVVCAKNEHDAKRIYPNRSDLYYKPAYYDEKDKKFKRMRYDGTTYSCLDSEWCNDLSEIKCQLIGIADKSQEEGSVVCASYNAG